MASVLAWVVLPRAWPGRHVTLLGALALVATISGGEGKAPGLLKSMLDSAQTVAFSADYTEAQRVTAVEAGR